MQIITFSYLMIFKIGLLWFFWSAVLIDAEYEPLVPREEKSKMVSKFQLHIILSNYRPLMWQLLNSIALYLQANSMLQPQVEKAFGAAPCLGFFPFSSSYQGKSTLSISLSLLISLKWWYSFMFLFNRFRRMM